MVKKIVAFLLMVTVLACSICSVSAATQMAMNDFLNLCVSFNEPVNVPVQIEGKLVGGTYGNYVSGNVGDGSLFRAVLNMSNVKTNVGRALNEASERLAPADLTAFKNVSVSGSFTVTASWTGVNSPTYAVNDTMTGFTFDGATTSTIFESAKVTAVTSNSVTVTINVKDTVKVDDLSALPNEIILEQAGFSLVSDGNMNGEITGATTIKTSEVGYSDVGITFNFTNPISPVVIDVETSVGGGGSSSSTKYTLKYESNGGTVFADESHSKGKEVKLDKVPVREGYVFDGWYEDAEFTNEVTSVTITENTTVYAKWVKERPPVPEMLNGVDHFAYVIGYPDGTVRPNDNITRAEVTTIFFRLLKDEVRDGNLIDENIFDDVNSEDWHNLAVSTMAKLGIVNGRSTNIFAPDEFITRAEFTTICARFESLEVERTNNFTDIDEHWAKSDILEAAAYGWIEGYDDNTFRPDEFITRAEAMTLINRVLNRVHKDHGTLLDGMATWSDNSDESAWYYTAVQEATNSNEYEHINSVYKKWTKLMENRDWSEYQK